MQTLRGAVLRKGIASGVAWVSTWVEVCPKARYFNHMWLKCLSVSVIYYDVNLYWRGYLYGQNFLADWFGFYCFDGYGLL